VTITLRFDERIQDIRSDKAEGGFDWQNKEERIDKHQ
jgi:hypothetical protein